MRFYGSPADVQEHGRRKERWQRSQGATEGDGRPRHPEKVRARPSSLRNRARPSSLRTHQPCACEARSTGPSPSSTWASRDRDEDFFEGVAKKNDKGSKAKAAPKTPKAPDTIKLPLIMVEQILSLDIALPTTAADVDKTLEALASKRAFYERRQAEEIRKGEEEERLEREREAAGESAAPAAEEPETAAAPEAAEPEAEAEVADEAKADEEEKEEGEI